MLRLLSLLFICLAPLLAPTTGLANCNGIDLRSQLSPETRARLDKAVAAVPFATGNHWIARKGEQQIHIIGTMHLGDGRMHRVMRTLRPVIKSADLVFLEQNPAQWNLTPEQAMQRLQNHFVLPNGKSLPEMVSREEWQRLLSMTGRMGLSHELAPRMQPWVYAEVFARSSCGVRGFTSPHGLDTRIARYALRHGKPIGGLEQLGDGLRAFSGRRVRDQVAHLQLTMHSEVQRNDIAVTLREAYFDEALTEGWILAHWQQVNAAAGSAREADRLMEQLNRRLHDDRNRAWLPVLLKRPEQVIFVAVGAAHLPGKNGLLNLLKRRGFSLERAAYR